MICGIQIHANAYQATDELESLSKACFSSVPLIIIQRFTFPRKEFHHDKGTTTYYLYYRAMLSVIKPQFYKLFFMTYCRIALCMNFKMKLFREASLNESKSTQWLFFLIKKKKVNIQVNFAWEIKDAGYRYCEMKVCFHHTDEIVSTPEHLESAYFNCPHAAQGPQELYQVQRNCWLPILPFTQPSPLQVSQEISRKYNMGSFTSPSWWLLTSPGITQFNKCLFKI